MPDACPCCGQLLAPAQTALSFVDKYRAVMKDGRMVKLTALQYLLVSAVRRCGLTLDELVNVAYGQRVDGGPETAFNVVLVSLSQANKRLQKLGVAVKAERRGSGQTPYRIRSI